MTAKRETIAAAVGMLSEFFRVELSPPAAAAYKIALGDLTEAELGVAVKRALRESKFMPTGVELLAFARPPRNIAADALEAWTAVRGAVDRLDYTASVDFGDLVNAIVRNLGGWQYLCNLGVHSLDVWARKEFLRVYAELAHVDATKLRGEPLAGFLGAPPVQVAIGGKLPAERKPALPANGAGEVHRLVRELAEDKS